MMSDWPEVLEETLKRSRRRLAIIHVLAYYLGLAVCIIGFLLLLLSKGG